MFNCIYHPGWDSVFTLYQKNYCSACRTGIMAAQVKVRKHCEPREYFIIYEKANTWIKKHLGVILTNNFSRGSRCYALEF